jgi:uncharacterized protein YyaL (SSP411 family)
VPDHAEVLKRQGRQAVQRPASYLCRGKVCLPPAHTVKELSDRLKELAQGVSAGGEAMTQ